MRSLTELAAVLGVAVPAGLQPDREGCRTVQRLVLGAIRERRPLAEELFAPLMGAAIHHPDPSLNARFVEPLVGDFGRRRVQLALIDVMRAGTDEARPGAAHAWYQSLWCQSLVPMSSVEDGVPEDRRPSGCDNVEGLRVQWDEACLRALMATAS